MKAARHGGRFGDFGLFWFCLSRMTLCGLGLGAGLGTLYGLMLGGLTFPYGIGFMLIGPLSGTAAGLSLGHLEGAVLFAVTLVLRQRGLLRDVGRYRRTAGWTCAAVCIVASALFWGVIVWRTDGSFSAQVALTRDLPETFIIVVVPSLIAAWATWWSGRRVAGQQHARETLERSGA